MWNISITDSFIFGFAIYTQVELRLEGCNEAGFLMIPRSKLDEIPYLKALTSSRWQPSPVFQRHYTLMPSKEWNNDLTLLTELLFSLKSEKCRYRLPREWRTFSLIRLADMLGIDTTLQEMSIETLIPVQMLDNSNSIRDVCTRLKTAYWLSENLATSP